MSADLIVLLAGYVFVLAAGLLWIAMDAETEYIFEVFGKSFYFMWFYSGRRWKYIFDYGWRLLLLVLLTVTEAYLAYRAASAVVESSFGAWSVILFVALAAISLFLIPWIRITCWIRFQRAIHKTAKQLTPVVERIATSSDISVSLDDAQYRTDAGWSSWHPKSVTEWPFVLPVAYVHAPPTTAVMFPVDWETFLAWKLTDQHLPRSGSALPFNGTGSSRFLFRDAHPLRGLPDWSVVQTELTVDEFSEID